MRTKNLLELLVSISMHTISEHSQPCPIGPGPEGDGTQHQLPSAVLQMVHYDQHLSSHTGPGCRPP